MPSGLPVISSNSLSLKQNGAAVFVCALRCVAGYAFVCLLAAKHAKVAATLAVEALIEAAGWISSSGLRTVRTAPDRP